MATYREIIKMRLEEMCRVSCAIQRLVNAGYG